MLLLLLLLLLLLHHGVLRDVVCLEVLFERALELFGIRRRDAGSSSCGGRCRLDGDRCPQRRRSSGGGRSRNGSDGP